MKKAGFKAGDKVRCVDVEDTLNGCDLVLGEVYTVKAADERNVEIEKDGEKVGGFFPRRFEKVEETGHVSGPATDVQSLPRFAVGDKVRLRRCPDFGTYNVSEHQPTTGVVHMTREDGSYAHTTADELELVPTVSESARRKGIPLCTGVLDYFPAALEAVAQLSKAGNDKHNPGQPLHHARGKSMDHADCLLRHLKDRGEIDSETGLSHTVAVAWRALAMLQEELEAAGAPKARGAK